MQILRRIEDGTATEADIDLLTETTGNVVGKSFCALGDGAGSPITSSLKYFPDEYEAHLAGDDSPGGCPFDPDLSTVFAKGGTA